MRRYESVVILDPELADDEIVGLTERFGNVIKNNGGEIIKIEDWGSKRLAYLVRKKDKGRYILFDFVGLPAVMREVERQFKITEEVMKFLSVKLDENVDLEAFKANAAQQEAAAAEAAAAEAAAKEAAAAEAAAKEAAAREAAEAAAAAAAAPATPGEPAEAPAPEPPTSQPETAVSAESPSEGPVAEPTQETAEAPVPKEQASVPEKQNEEV